MHELHSIMTPISSISTKGFKLRVHVNPRCKHVPNSSYSGFTGAHDERLKIKIKAKALEGAANEAIKAFVAEQFGVTNACNLARRSTVEKQNA
jgi:uncharacterized protein YggU (UPF0235/DUF167 family)